MHNNVYKQCGSRRLNKSLGTFGSRRIFTNPTFDTKKIKSGLCKNRLVLNRIAFAILARTAYIQIRYLQAKKNRE